MAVAAVLTPSDVVTRRSLTTLGWYTLERRSGPAHLRHLADLEHVPVSASQLQWRVTLAPGLALSQPAELFRTRTAAVDAVLDLLNQAVLVEEVHPCLDDVRCTLPDGHPGGCLSAERGDDRG